MTLVSETGTVFDVLIFEDGTLCNRIHLKLKFEDFEERNRVAEEAKQNLDLVQKCFNRTSELVSEERSFSVSDSSISSVTSSPSHKASSASKLTRKTRGSVQADLSAVRKQHEKTYLPKIIARQRQQQQQDHPPMAKPKNVNLQIISDLISRRQDAYSSLNDRLFSLFESFSSSHKADEDIWRRTLKLSLASSTNLMEPNSAIVGLMAHPSHPISRLVRDFVSRIRHLLVAEGDNLSQIVIEYHQFCFQLVRLLRHNYSDEIGSDPAAEMPLYLSIESFFFAHLQSLSSSILDKFAQINREEDSQLLKKCIELSWTDFDSELALFEVLGVKERYRLLSEKCPYEQAISELRRLDSYSSPTAKVLSLIRVCDSICAVLDANEGGESDAMIGSEDLVLLLSYVLVKAQVRDIFTHFSFMSDLLPEGLLRGQAGYVLATLQTCLDFISTIK